MLRASLVCLLLAGPAFAQEPATVPFRLSKTQHIVVRVKIDDKGPFNLVVDTGCPVLLLSTEAAKKAGLTDEKGVAVIKKLEFEGGLVQEKVKTRVETPFQIEGMNAMGLPGVELHGLLGYTVLAKYKMEIDFSRERMTWTPLAFDPPAFGKMKIKDGDGTSIEIMGTVLKLMARLTGLKPAPPGVPRGFTGVTLAEQNKKVIVTGVLDDSPAAAAGVKVNDEISAINDRPVAKLADVQSILADVRIGREIVVGVNRGDEALSLKVKTAGGF